MVDILLTTYNGEKYLHSQIDSIFAQTYMDWKIMIIDDCSTDKTCAIIDEYINKYPGKIEFYKNNKNSGDPASNFFKLLSMSKSDYVMFCDQDDVWLPDKIELSMQAMETIRQRHIQCPIIIFTDMFVVDENLSIIHNSYWKYSKIYPQYIRSFNDCAATAAVSGCTMLFNHQAKECCAPAGPKVFMHDCWVCICTLKKNGILHYIEKPLNYYRQHGGNCMGAGENTSKMGLYYRITHIRSRYIRNKAQLSMLNLLGYGSDFKYILYKIKYRQRIKSGRY